MVPIQSTPLHLISTARIPKGVNAWLHCFHCPKIRAVANNESAP